MTNNTRIAFYACLLLLAMIVGACVKDSTVPESIHKQPQDFKFSEARAFFDENAKMPANSLILFESSTTKSTTAVDSLSPLSYFTVLWDNVKSVELTDSHAYEIPLLHNIPLSAVLFAKTDTGYVHTAQNIILQSNLIIRKFHKTGRIRMFISTAVGRNLLPDSLTTDTSPLFWSGNKTHFEGYEFYTALNGHPIHYAHRFKEGHKTKVFLEKCEKKEDAAKGGFMFARTHTHTRTKGTGEEGDYGKCKECGEDLDSSGQCTWCHDSLDEVLVIGEVNRCPSCGQMEHLCRCDANATCPMCGNKPCSCFDYDLPDNPERPVDPEIPDEPPGGGEPSDTTTYYSINAAAEPVSAGKILGIKINNEYKRGDKATLTATPEQSYIFAYWSGDLSGNDSLQTITIYSNITTSAHFYHIDSDCGKLFKIYNRNPLMIAALGEMDKILPDTTKNKIEHGFYPYNNSLEYKEGVEGHIVIPDDKGKLGFFMHNHPKNALIPSIADIIGIYKCYKNGIFPEGSPLIIVTYEGSLGIEVSNIYALENFLNKYGFLKATGDDLDELCKQFELRFHHEVLGNPPSSKLDEYCYTEKTVKYYIPKGLKFTHRFSTDSHEEWSYATYENDSLKFRNCITPINY